MELRGKKVSTGKTKLITGKKADMLQVESYPVESVFAERGPTLYPVTLARNGVTRGART